LVIILKIINIITEKLLALQNKLNFVRDDKCVLYTKL
jgi:hypothetical protein